MKYFNKRLMIAVLLVFMAVSISSARAISFSDYNVLVDASGQFTLNGSVLPVGMHQITLKVVDKLSGAIKYIDQFSSDSNGHFSITGRISDYSKTRDYAFFVGGEGLTQPLEHNWVMYDLNSISDNSLRVGTDIYELNSSYLTSNNVINSIKSGGNTIYFKFMGTWFDVMDPMAKTAEYFTDTKNAVDTSEWIIDKWYTEKKGVIQLN